MSLSKIDLIEKCELYSKDDIYSKLLSKNSELSTNRKNIGAFYTPEDLADYVVSNSFIHNSFVDIHDLYSFDYTLEMLPNYPDICSDLIFNKTVFDPTAGSGEMLISALKLKIYLALELYDSIDDNQILKIISTLFANDYNPDAITTMKDRIFIYCKRLFDSDKYKKNIYQIMKRNFTCKDYIKPHYLHDYRFDIIVGNPPYVEDSKYDGDIKKKYGNVYCNVFSNCFDNLNNNGTLVLITPISYMSTPRMIKIRNEVRSKNCTQIISSYSDRPDCLFQNVHQKLNINIIKLGTDNNDIFTSNYFYWLKDERLKLFKNIRTYKNNYVCDSFIPKIGNSFDNSIYKKVVSGTNDFYDLINNDSKTSIYLNMRAAFWIKCFTKNSKSNEYNTYKFDNDYVHFIYCLLNSSLFFWLWVSVSDGWHITSKELSLIKIDNLKFDNNKMKKLASKLENRLEKTKEYIGSVQIDYIYKHKKCKNIIDEIDDELAIVYNLNERELNYIKNFSLKYRMNIE